MERCANCDRTIGHLETPAVWQDNIVCGECHDRLAAAGPAVADPVSAFSCPSCGTDSTVRCSVLWRSGTRTSSGLAVGGFDGQAGGGLGLAALQGTSQSALAAQCAPPPRPTSAFWTYMILAAVNALPCAGLALLYFHPDPEARMWGIIGASFFGAVSVGCAALAFHLDKYAKKKVPAWEDAWRQWNRAWICTRCGTVFEPASTPA